MRYAGASAASMNGIRLRESSVWGPAIAMHQALRRSGAAASRLECQWRACRLRRTLPCPLSGKPAARGSGSAVKQRVGKESAPTPFAGPCIGRHQVARNHQRPNPPAR